MTTEKGDLSTAEKILRAIEPLIYARRKLTMFILLAITALLAWQAVLIKQDAGFDKSIPLEHPFMQVLKQYQDDFGGANTVLVALIQKEGKGDIYNEKFLTKLKSVTDDIFFLEGIDRSRVSSLFTPDVRYIEVVEGGFKGGNVIPAEYAPTPEMFQVVRENVGKSGIIGRYTTKDQHGAMIFAELLEVDPVTGQKLDYKKVATQLEQSIRAKYQDEDVSVHILGFSKVVGDVIDATLEVVMYFGLTLVMTFVLLWMYIGSVRLAWLPLACSITAVIWEFGLLKLCGFGLDPFAILVPFLILAVSVSHGVQYVNAWVGEIHTSQRSPFDASLETWRRLAIYGTMAIMTDVAGFAMIMLVPIDIIREMSINATLGMAAIILTNKVMMPIWLTWVKIGDLDAFIRKQEKRDAVFDGLWRLLSNMTRVGPAVTVLLLGAVLFGWSLYKGQDLQVGDSQAGVPELRPDSRYNKDTAAVVANFSIGTDIFKVIAEADPEACIKHEVMDQIDRFGWRMENTAKVSQVVSLPWAARKVNAAYSEANPKWRILPRNQYTMVQAITPIPTSSGMLNPDCSALPVIIFTSDHRAGTISHIVSEVERYNEENAKEFYETHPDANADYCAKKTLSRREVGVNTQLVRRTAEKMRKMGMKDAQIDASQTIKDLTAKRDASVEAFKKLDKMCPVNFAMASANIGVMAATNEEVHRLEKRILFYVYLAIIVCVVLSFWHEKLPSVISIMLPLALVSWMAYAIMAIKGIGMKVATLPVVALAVGIGVDYGIYIYATFADAVAAGFRYQEAYYKTLRMTGKAVVFTGVTLGLGVATWLFSDLQFQRDMGYMLVFMFTANMFGAILILPAIARFLLTERELAPGETPVFRSRH
ncbi:MAG TPA: MMPL family transporter [Candidatus Binatia bacterium]|nr:MMPL family transporter [Candidatus Binatia bacterium]